MRATCWQKQLFIETTFNLLGGKHLFPTSVAHTSVSFYLKSVPESHLKSAVTSEGEARRCHSPRRPRPFPRLSLRRAGLSPRPQPVAARPEPAPGSPAWSLRTHFLPEPETGYTCWRSRYEVFLLCGKYVLRCSPYSAFRVLGVTINLTPQRLALRPSKSRRCYRLGIRSFGLKSVRGCLFSWLFCLPRRHRVSRRFPS